MKIKIKLLSRLYFVLMSFALAACQSGWQIELISNDLTQGLITSSEVKFYLDQSELFTDRRDQNNI